jgi:hypothetical protein
MALTRHTQEASAEARYALSRLERIYLRGLADPGALLIWMRPCGSRGAHRTERRGRMILRMKQLLSVDNLQNYPAEIILWAPH